MNNSLMSTILSINLQSVDPVLGQISCETDMTEYLQQRDCDRLANNTLHEEADDDF